MRALSPSFSRTDSTSLRRTRGEMKGTVIGGWILGGRRRTLGTSASVESLDGGVAASEGRGTVASVTDGGSTETPAV